MRCGRKGCKGSTTPMFDTEGGKASLMPYWKCIICKRETHSDAVILAYYNSYNNTRPYDIKAPVVLLETYNIRKEPTL